MKRGWESLSDNDSVNEKSLLRTCMPILEREKRYCVTGEKCVIQQENVGERHSPGSLWRKPVAEVAPWESGCPAAEKG